MASTEEWIDGEFSGNLGEVRAKGGGLCLLACLLLLLLLLHVTQSPLLGHAPQVLIRCNNVLYMRGLPEEDDE